MLEEHSGGNYPFPALEIRHKGAGDNVNYVKSGNLMQNKHLSNSAESLNRKSGNLAPSKYYHTDQLAWRLVNTLMQLFYSAIVVIIHFFPIIQFDLSFSFLVQNHFKKENTSHQSQHVETGMVILICMTCFGNKMNQTMI